MDERVSRVPFTVKGLEKRYNTEKRGFYAHSVCLILNLYCSLDFVDHCRIRQSVLLCWNLPHPPCAGIQL